MKKEAIILALVLLTLLIAGCGEKAAEEVSEVETIEEITEEETAQEEATEPSEDYCLEINKALRNICGVKIDLLMQEYDWSQWPCESVKDRGDYRSLTIEFVKPTTFLSMRDFYLTSSIFGVKDKTGQLFEGVERIPGDWEEGYIQVKESSGTPDILLYTPERYGLHIVKDNYYLFTYEAASKPNIDIICTKEQYIKLADELVRLIFG